MWDKKNTLNCYITKDTRQHTIQKDQVINDNKNHHKTTRHKD
jgi:hypothetical protein